MKTKEQRYNELYSSGLVDSIKELFANRNDISEDYYVLMADYIDSMNEIKNKANHTNYKLSTLFPKFSFSHIALRNKS